MKPKNQKPIFVTDLTATQRVGTTPAQRANNISKDLRLPTQKTAVVTQPKETSTWIQDNKKEDDADSIDWSFLDKEPETITKMETENTPIVIDTIVVKDDVDVHKISSVETDIKKKNSELTKSFSTIPTQLKTPEKPLPQTTPQKIEKEETVIQMTDVDVESVMSECCRMTHTHGVLTCKNLFPIVKKSLKVSNVNCLSTVEQLGDCHLWRFEALKEVGAVDAHGKSTESHEWEKDGESVIQLLMTLTKSPKNRIAAIQLLEEIFSGYPMYLHRMYQDVINTEITVEKDVLMRMIDMHTVMPLDFKQQQKALDDIVKSFCERKFIDRDVGNEVDAIHTMSCVVMEGAETTFTVVTRMAGDITKSAMNKILLIDDERSVVLLLEVIFNFQRTEQVVLSSSQQIELEQIMLKLEEKYGTEGPFGVFKLCYEV
ncbi:hypothetical protein EIN_034080 [Entamoeba invadens IP1]|uniref:Uncharacterized protein n=1 Tax=Entamoeba invadens IP1 TaxID=370355 RepID=A0A0A1TYA1_ENTIV|nr:hypothetical protein EIN_034080 [Entamoeba invadens IP1]ELP86497.1 hypothetical protein EIN_034080 [Entamoeba invadens IP1]|eukprot:XP_004185843.1 hypothetical protein EIN_034080 [Entamoeba invadens IP1]